MDSTKPLAVVLLSGGMDSCVTAAVAALDYRLAALHSDYGQRTEARELQAFEAIADRLGVERRLRLADTWPVASRQQHRP